MPRESEHACAAVIVVTINASITTIGSQAKILGIVIFANCKRGNNRTADQIVFVAFAKDQRRT